MWVWNLGVAVCTWVCRSVYVGCVACSNVYVGCVAVYVGVVKGRVPFLAHGRDARFVWSDFALAASTLCLVDLLIL